MTTKAAPISFQPAPRPHPRSTPEQARELAEATRELGFGRTTSTKDQAGAGETAARPVTPPATPTQPRKGREANKTAKSVATAADASGARKASLKIEMADETWTALRHEALNRRVTVKYLVMEALAEKGYDVDLSTISEDGRRAR